MNEPIILTMHHLEVWWIFEAFGSILAISWAQVGGQVGAKLAPKSEEMGYQDDVKKSSKIWSRDATQVVLEWSVGKSGLGPE